MQILDINHILRPDDGSKKPADLMIFRYKTFNFIEHDEFHACCRIRRDYLFYMIEQQHFATQQAFERNKMRYWCKYRDALQVINPATQRMFTATVLDNLPVGRPERFPKKPPPEMAAFRSACIELLNYYKELDKNISCVRLTHM